ncbi:uncharacterized protein YcaQ [Sphingomonas sp. UYAg733]
MKQVLSPTSAVRELIAHVPSPHPLTVEVPLTAADFEGSSSSGWWEWSDTKHALEYLFWAGLITTATRRGNFTRVYDLMERVIPPAILRLPTPDAATAQRHLVDRSAQALDVATPAELRDYLRLKPHEADHAIIALADEDRLIPVKVEGSSLKTWLHCDDRVPRRIGGAALLAPFDPLIWGRDRTERLFGFRHRIEIYVPQHLRSHGYYVLPFLLVGHLVARVDLKADRQAGILRAQRIRPLCIIRTQIHGSGLRSSGMRPLASRSR